MLVQEGMYLFATTGDGGGLSHITQHKRNFAVHSDALYYTLCGIFHIFECVLFATFMCIKGCVFFIFVLNRKSQ